MNAPGEPNASARSGRVVELVASDLPAYCPNPSTPLWSSHPLVYLDVVNESEVICPYCGTRYRLKRDARVHDHGFDTRELHQHTPWQVLEPLAHARQQADVCESRRETTEVAVDRLGNTTLEQITRWLRGER